MTEKRGLALVMLIAVILPFLFACDSTQPADTETLQSPADTVKIRDGLSGEFEGQTFTILSREENEWCKYGHEITADADDTDIVNAAVYRRNTAIENKYKIKFNYVTKPGEWNMKNSFVDSFSRSILAGAGSYDLIMSQQAYMNDPTLFDIYINLYDIPTLDLTSDCFNSGYTDEMTINGKLYCALGDYSLSYAEDTNVLFYNKTMAKELGINDLYQLVRNGDWIFDKMAEYSFQVWRDLNGDQWPDMGDRFAYITDYENTTDALFSQFDIQPTSLDENGEHIINPDCGKIVSVLEKMIAFFNDDSVFAYKSNSAMRYKDNPLDEMFSDGKALFYPSTLMRVSRFRDMEDDYGILPYPKWDKKQKDYQTQAQNGYSVAVIPSDAADPEMSGAILGALSEGSAEVIDTYFNRALSTKYSTDSESSEMLDIIRNGMQINFGYSNYSSLGVGGWFRVLLYNENSNFVTYYAANRTAYERNLSAIVSAYQ